MDVNYANNPMESNFVNLKDVDFLDDEVDDITLSQVCEDMELENAAFEGIDGLSISQACAKYDVYDDTDDEKFDIQLPDDGNFNIQLPEVADNRYFDEEFDEPKCDLSDDRNFNNQDLQFDGVNERFGVAIDETYLQNLVEGQENQNTKSNTKWAINVFEKWRNQRSENIPELDKMDTIVMNFWLQRFIVEARRQDGKYYPPKTLYLLTCGLLRYLRDKGVYDKNFLDENNLSFVTFRKVLDAHMKWLIDMGYGCSVKQADPIEPSDENKLWQDKVFGRDSPEQLQRTVFYYASKLFGLRACDEHHSLKCEQFEVGEDQKGRFIQFIGRSSKTYKGGLGQLKVQNKNLKHYCQPGDRCIADYFSLYLEALGHTGMFYRRPLAGLPDQTIRFGNQNVGMNKLKSFMKVICTKGGLEGYFTNHSVKRTCATQLYNAGVDEQEIMARTGHRSQTGVRKYKRSSDEMCANVSKILDPPDSKRLKSEDVENVDIKCEANTKEMECDSARNLGDASRVLKDISKSSVFNNCLVSFNF